jgi:hypothetical protein
LTYFAAELGISETTALTEYFPFRVQTLSINKMKSSFGRVIPLAALVVLALTRYGLAVEPIRDDVVLQSNVCEIHHLHMKPQLVPILYGLPTAAWKQWLEAQQKR